MTIPFNIRLPICATILGASLLLTSQSFAQYGGNWGTGMYGGANACGYQIDIGDEATSISDDISAETDRLKDMQDELNNAKKELREKKSAAEKDRREFARNGYEESSAVYVLVKHHIETQVHCENYAGDPATTSDKCKSNPNDDACKTAAASTSTAGESRVPFTSSEWRNICDLNTNALNSGEVCNYKGAGSKAERHYSSSSSGCSDSLTSWQKDFLDSKQAQAKVERLNQDIKDQKKYIAGMKKDFKNSVKDYQRDQQRDSTEGGCYECMLAGNGAVYKPYKESALQVGGQVALGLGAMFMGNQLYKTVSSNNAQLGFPTAPVSSFGFGFPYFAGALYGAIGGGGMAGGSFGCGTSMGGGGNAMGPYGMMGPWGMQGMYGPGGQMGGPFGYPAGMYGSPMGGGMFNPGMGPWGMNGPWGLGGNMMGGMPGMGMMAGGMMGMMAGGGMGMMSPYGGMGMMAGGGIGMMAGGGMGMMSPYGGMMSPGMGMMGGMGMMSPYGMGMMAGGGMMSPYGGMGMMSPDMGMMAGGGMMMPSGLYGGMGMMQGMMAGGGMGMMAGGGMGMMSPYGMMAGGGGMSPYGMMQGMMAGGGMGMMMGNYGLNGGMGGMQQYLQQMQQQQQMSQQYMQYQQRQMQNQMASQQVMSGLYTQLNQLMSQIQQVQMGASSGGSYSPYYLGPYGGGTSSLPGVGNGNNGVVNTPSTSAAPTVR